MIDIIPTRINKSEIENAFELKLTDKEFEELKEECEDGKIGNLVDELLLSLIMDWIRIEREE